MRAPRRSRRRPAAGCRAAGGRRALGGTAGAAGPPRAPRGAAAGSLEPDRGRPSRRRPGLPRRAAPFERRGSGSARRVSLWRGWALGASALAAGLAGFIVLRPAEPPRLMTVLLTQRDQPAWVVEADRSGALRLASINPQPVEANRVMQLWALPQGATAPTSLGLVPEGGRMTVTPSAIRAAPGMLIEITLEPPGGSPIGRPTGPVLFIGRLSAAGSS
ncbi:anti-sigma factor domain-containing protein [Paeniroseomonas aquatica]|uniref:anti-sigma factor n=1 Tax=Paeniroseomonas aquatica TaxID=373043 RepID=UPI003608F7BF